MTSALLAVSVEKYVKFHRDEDGAMKKEEVFQNAGWSGWNPIIDVTHMASATHLYVCH
jgi:hypothetical protein